MLRTKGLALAWLVGGSLTLAAPLALADDNSASARKDRVEERADNAKDRVDDATKAEKKAVEEHAEARKDALDRKADQKKANIDSQANADKAAIERGDKVAVDRGGDKDSAKDEVSDSWITTKLKARIASDKALKGSDISVDTDHSGEVTLTGTAPSKKASQRAFQLASTTKGVRTVNNQLVVSNAK